MLITMSNNKLKAAASAILLIFSLSFFVSAAKYDAVSPAIYVLQNQNVMTRSALSGYDIKFDKQELCDFFGVSDIGSVSIRSLPPAASGTLKIGAVDVTKDSIISANLIKDLRFVGNGDASFEFSAEANGQTLFAVCRLKFYDTLNFAPSTKGKKETLCCMSGIAVYETIDINDTEGDECKLIIASEPKYGSVTVCGNDSVRYTANGGYFGRDFFDVCAEDEYGNVSKPSRIYVNVEKSNKIKYGDMKNNDAYYSAVKLADAGVFEKTENFLPNDTISREEFVTYAIKALKLDSALGLYPLYPFGDVSNIKEEYRAYVALAYKLGAINGSRNENDGKIYFEPQRACTRDEAYLIVSRLLSLPKSTLQNEDPSLPSWSKDAYSSLSECKIISSCESGGFDRAECAKFLYSASIY